MRHIATTRYTVRRIDWNDLAWKLGGRAAIAILGPLAYVVGAFHTWPF